MESIKNITKVVIVAGVIVSGIIINDKIENHISSVDFNGETISFPYTDDNTGENLIIRTDAETYSSWDSVYVNFAIKNISGSDQNTDIQLLSEGNESVSVTEQLVKDVPYNITVDDFDTKKTCEDLPAVKEGFLKREATTTCSFKKIGSHQETKYKDQWQTVSGKTVVNLDLGQKKEPAKFNPKNQIGFFIPAGETGYFRAKLNFSTRSTGEFYIKAKGDNGGVGLLDPFYSSSWLYRKAITIDKTKVPNTNRTNFPVLVDITDANLASNAQADGDDILFTSVDGTTKLDHEIEMYTSATGRLSAWVRVPTLSTSVDTVIYMYYGNSGASNQQNPTGVWESGYKAVYHLPNGTTLSGSDSTSNAINLTNSGASAATGKIDGASSYAGGQAMYSTTLPTNTTGDFTMSLWAYLDSNSSEKVYISNGYDDGFGGNGYTIEGYGNNFALLYNGVARVSAAATYSTGVWYYLVLSRISGTGTLYIDGTSSGATSGSGVNTPTTIFTIGAQGATSAPTFNGRYANGTFDEVRVSDVGRSADWIATEYNNQNATSTFYTIGSQETDTPVVTNTTPKLYLKGKLQILGGKLYIK